jgi:hypothetical protein
MVAKLDHVAAALDALRLVVFFHPDRNEFDCP